MIRFTPKLRPRGAANASFADARPRGNASKAALAGLLAVGLALGLAACGGSSDASSGGDGSGGTIDLVAYSTPQTAYEETLEPGFTGTPEGEGVAFKNSFGASGDQSRAVEAGLPADIVHLPLEPDMTRLVEAGLIDRRLLRTPSTTAARRTRSSSSASVPATRRTSRAGRTSSRATSR